MKYTLINLEYAAIVVDLYGVLNKLALSCKGLCNRIKSVGTAMQFKYQEGQKRCSLCELFIDCDDARCPCCKTILRTKSRNRVSKIKRREKSYQ